MFGSFGLYRICPLRVEDEYTGTAKAIVTVDKDLAVTAGAGAGKTRVLVDRIIYILKNGLADIDEIVAITYTIKQPGDKGTASKEMLNKRDSLF